MTAYQFLEKMYPKVATIKVEREGPYYRLTIGSMYESPELVFKQLNAISKFFGTEEITVNGFSESGCETCDYGSSYGHDVLIKNATIHPKIGVKS